MKDLYDNDYGIELKACFDGKDSESGKTRYVTVYPVELWTAAYRKGRTNLSSGDCASR
jgi:hypothetical protein